MQTLSHLIISRCRSLGRVGRLGLCFATERDLSQNVIAPALAGTGRTKFVLDERPLCTTTTTTGTENDGEKTEGVKKKRKKEKIDTPYVLRRTEYMQKVSSLRKDFLEDIKADRVEKEKINEKKYRQWFVNSEFRAQHKRARRAQRKEAHEALIKQMKEGRRQRAEHGFQMWQEAQLRREEKLKALASQLEKASAHWITEDTLDDAITNVIDDFFIVSGRQTELERQS